MKVIALSVALLLSVVPLHAQDQGGLSTRNPLDEIKDELKQTLAAAQVPFSEDQERAITLVLEESRRASEDLFGEVMDFRNGPPTGERLDLARAGIQWMNDDFSKRVRSYLSGPQLAAWDQRLASKAASESTKVNTAGTKEQVEQIRINNNPFTTEDQFYGVGMGGGSYGFSNGGGITTEIFQRGGTGAFHGTTEFRFQDASLNARNAFSPTRPPYQQRNFNFNTSGPVIRNRLTLSVGASQTDQENVGTINAETVDGSFTLGFTRPAVSRNAYGSGTFQLTKNQSVQFSLNYGMSRLENQGMGGFSLPDRAFINTGGSRNLSLRHVWFKSESTVQDISYNYNNYHNELAPAVSAPAIDVLGAFSSGGFPQSGGSSGASHSLRALWIHTGSRWAVRTGGLFYYVHPIQTAQNNFLGTFTFSDLDAFRTGHPATFRITRGNPRIEITHIEWSMFVQNDYKFSNRLTFSFGLRSEAQNDLADRNNIDPRIGVAYALGKSTVVRAGAGLFHLRMDNWVVLEVDRLDGKRQYEVVVDKPSYPNPFQSGDVTVVPSASRRVWAEKILAPYNLNVALAVERSLPRNLFVSASYDYSRGIHLLRSRDLNAPLPGALPDLDGRIPRPDPSQGNVWQLESAGLTTWNAFRVSMRQRFSIFNLNANYTFQVNTGDASEDGPFATASNNYNLAADWASVRRHQFTTSVNSRLPLGVFLTTNFALNNGNPYSITTGTDDNGDGIFNDRPSGVHRLSESGPIYRNVSFNISKAFRVGKTQNGGGANLNVFANVNNAFNFVNFGTPNGVITSPFFRKPTSASNPREIEVGTRFQF
jgi:hypothetical protein